MRGPTLALAAELADEFGPVRVFRPHVTRRFRPDAPPLRTDTGGVATSPGGCGLAVVLSADALTVTVGHWRFDRDQRRRYRAAVDAVESGEELAGLLRRLAADGFPADPEGELRILPRGWRADHPRIWLARRRGLQVVRRWELGPWVSTPEPLERVRSAWRAAAPLVGWLDTHVGRASPPAAPGRPAACGDGAARARSSRWARRRRGPGRVGRPGGGLVRHAAWRPRVAAGRDGAAGRRLRPVGARRWIGPTWGPLARVRAARPCRASDEPGTCPGRLLGPLPRRGEQFSVALSAFVSRST